MTLASSRTAMHLCSYGLSDVGRRRQLNEDSFIADDDLGLYVVADGVGGQARGEVASAEAVEEVHGFVRRERARLEGLLGQPTDENIHAARRIIESAVQAACYMIFGLAELDPHHRGMSTTMSVLYTATGLGVVAQVGDSRVYRLRDAQAEQLTEDHTLLNYKLKHGLISRDEAERSSGKNVITRAVGHRDYVQVDTLECHVLGGDRFLLCSDGLYGYLQHDELTAQLSAGTLAQVAQRLIALANDRGGRDNITALLVDVKAP